MVSDMTVPTPPTVTDHTRDANARNGAAPVATSNGYTGIDNGAPPKALDTDADGLTDDFEKLAGTNAASADSDSDGLTDGFEALRSHTDPLAEDTDSDGISDAAEIAARTDAGAIPDIAGVSGLGDYAQNIRAGVVDTDLDGLTDPTSFDRSELTRWAAHQAGIEIPDTSAAQYLDLKAKGLLIPVDQAAHTPGALLFNFSSEPTAGSARPDIAQIAISQGNGTTVEADDVQGVTSMQVGSRFQYAAVLPGLQGVPPTAPSVPGYQIDPGVDISNPDMDSDSDGLTNHFESVLGSNPTMADSDLDGLVDGFEASLGINPMRMDTDLDGFTDGMEVRYGMNPLQAGTGSPMGSPPLGSPMGAPVGTPSVSETDPGVDDDHLLTVDAGLEMQ